MEDSKAKHLLDLFLKNPGSMVSWALIISAATITYSNLASASKDQDRKITAVEKKVDDSAALDNDRAVERRNQVNLLSSQINDLARESAVMKNNIQWIVQAIRPLSNVPPPRNP